jgi:8-oxo-dGTP pyrophosphatase MutT (NUDIX family)
MMELLKNPEPPEELLRQFDKDGNEIEPRTRQWMWDHPEYEPYHAVGTIWLINGLGQICFSKRSEHLKGSPGKWQTMFGGKVPVGSTGRETAIRELEEEAGIIPDPTRLFLVEETKRAARYIYPFGGSADDLHFDDGEIVAIRWMTLDEYQAEEKAHPELWCNPIKPHQEIVIREWMTKHCGTFGNETKK